MTIAWIVAALIAAVDLPDRPAADIQIAASRPIHRVTLPDLPSGYEQRSMGWASNRDAMLERVRPFFGEAVGHHVAFPPFGSLATTDAKDRIAAQFALAFSGAPEAETRLPDGSRLFVATQAHEGSVHGMLVLSADGSAIVAAGLLRERCETIATDDCRKEALLAMFHRTSSSGDDAIDDEVLTWTRAYYTQRNREYAAMPRFLVRRVDTTVRTIDP